MLSLVNWICLLNWQERRASEFGTNSSAVQAAASARSEERPACSSIYPARRRSNGMQSADQCRRCNEKIRPNIPTNPPAAETCAVMLQRLQPKDSSPGRQVPQFPVLDSVCSGQTSSNPVICVGKQISTETLLSISKVGSTRLTCIHGTQIV